jgi:hypothetical protein
VVAHLHLLTKEKVLEMSKLQDERLAMLAKIGSSELAESEFIDMDSRILSELVTTAIDTLRTVRLVNNAYTSNVLDSLIKELVSVIQTGMIVIVRRDDVSSGEMKLLTTLVERLVPSEVAS